ncbi:Hypothetical protein FKW44_004635 [Caligus rogercresseyi]|uniref:Uncharacterized protein n=1 Tax=Caligus rogercresseyi TaxID=217165 RepID=A0A7T8K8U8_CALRO|nr:Hypothetical protein FKW44_017586 [Caligus rogercresseyi]QQP49511.1 Hypothetical protein FKW44_010213 [Caligus rogercresseyi]QQP51914.1 Hypothetical protein FKW44_013410 [Caligus rogercresseyi]QQP52470.1 Hypothetical protein FKW44_004635 [Caligus rogercresseyi]
MREGSPLTDEDRRWVGLHSRSRGEGNASLNGREGGDSFLGVQGIYPGVPGR